MAKWRWLCNYGHEVFFAEWKQLGVLKYKERFIKNGSILPRAVAIFEAELDDRTITEHTEINVVLTVGLSMSKI